MKGLIALFFSWVFFTPNTSGSCVKGNCKIGFGAYIFSDGSKYIGKFMKGLPDGKGRLTMSIGDVYEGTFVKGKKQGDGKYYFSSGNIYTGQFYQDNLEGNGRMDYANHTVYMGQWKMNKPHGKGVFIDRSGRRTQGYWKNGEMVKKLGNKSNSVSSSAAKVYKNCNENYCHNESGKFLYGDGSYFVGHFNNGEPSGTGTCYYINGDVYTGGWKNHGPDGEGLITFSSGKKYSAIWESGYPVRQVFDKPRVVKTKRKSLKEADGHTEIFALIVGISSYDHMPSLKYPDDDAYHLYAFLKSPGGGALPDHNITLLVDESATREIITSNMKAMFEKADQDDMVIMYYSGHGLEGRLLPIDFDGYNNSLSHVEIFDMLSNSSAKNKILIADACHSGSISRLKGNLNHSLDNFYNKLNASGSGTAVFMSSKAEEKSLEYSGLRQGVFSHFLLRGLKGEADEDKDDIVSVSELFRYTAKRVKIYTDNRQSPTIAGNFDQNMPISLVRDY